MPATDEVLDRPARLGSAPAKLGKTIDGINAAYEAAILKFVAGSEVRSYQDIDLAEPFFGVEWGIAEWNLQRQKWRWLSPYGQSHIYLKLPADTDHIIRAYIHTAASGQILESLIALVNGQVCPLQGYDWAADGVASHWCIVDRKLVAKNDGIAKITWSVVPQEKQAKPASEASSQSRNLLPRAFDTFKRLVGQDTKAAIKTDSKDFAPSFARFIAFSRIVCQPYPLRDPPTIS